MNSSIGHLTKLLLLAVEIGKITIGLLAFQKKEVLLFLTCLVGLLLLRPT